MRIVKFSKSRPIAEYKDVVDWQIYGETDEPFDTGRTSFGAIVKKFPEGWKVSSWLAQDHQSKMAGDIYWYNVDGNDGIQDAVEEFLPTIAELINSNVKRYNQEKQRKQEKEFAEASRQTERKDAILEVLGFYQSDLEKTRDYNPEVVQLVLEAAEKAGIVFTEKETLPFRGEEIPSQEA